MKLTDHEKRMRNGELGPARQKAIEFIVEYATALNAPRLVPISSVVGGMGSSKFMIEFYKQSGGDMDAVFSEFNLNSSEKVEVPVLDVRTVTSINLTDPEQSLTIGVSEEIHDFCAASEHYAKAKGMQCLYTCAPYLSGLVPTFGEHLAWMESSAVAVANSVFGARTNTESLESAGASSLSGRTPYWGLHCPENRYANYHFQVETAITRDRDYGLLGYHIGETVHEGVPAVSGLENRPSFDELRHFGAASAASGGVELYHIVGVTSEAHSLESVSGGKPFRETFRVTEEDISLVYRRLNSRAGRSDVDFVVLGCPHYSLDQVGELVQLLSGRSISASVEMWVFVPFTIKSICSRQGYTEILDRAGVKLLTDTCPIVAGLSPEGTRIAATNSAKQAHYLPSVLNVECYFGSTSDCVEAACSGKWRGEF
jgi:predicted aconitase